MTPRKKANLVLAAVFVLFIAAMLLNRIYTNAFWAQLLFAVAEAALVGGIADWFAVTALFEKPLGIPFHTALIPRNRYRLIDAVANAVQNEFLSTETILKQLSKVNLVRLLIRWIEEYDGRVHLKKVFSRIVCGLVESVDSVKAAALLERYVKNNISEIQFKPVLEMLCSWINTNNRLDFVLNFIARELKKLVERPETYTAIYLYLENAKQGNNRSYWAKLALYAAEKADMLNISDAAQVFQQELIWVLEDFERPDNEARVWAKDNFKQLCTKLLEDPEWDKAIENWRSEMVSQLTFKSELEIWIRQLLVGKENNISPIVGFILVQLEKYWELFLIDEHKQEWLECRMREILLQIINKQNVFIGNLVNEVLNGLSDKELNRFVEDKAGRDLAWIRMNGSIVGGLIGLLLFLFLTFIYDPYIMPSIKQLL